MQAHDTHVCLVSGQPTPNLTPILDPAMAPSRVILVTSADMQEQSDHLARVLAPRGIKVEKLPIANAWSFNDMSEAMQGLIDREQSKGHQLILNATGGTKLMSMAAYEVFRVWDRPIFYVHPESNECVWLWPKNHEQSTTIKANMKLETFLAAHGAIVAGALDRNLMVPALRDVTDELIKHATRYSQAVSYLSKLAASAENNGLRSELIAADALDAGPIGALIELLVEKRLTVRDGNRLRFPSVDEITFVKGGWFEGHVYETLRRVVLGRDEVQDAARNVVAKRTRGTKTIENELDVAVLARNRLYVIECKARKWTVGEQRPNDETLEAEVLYKLDSITETLGGLQARGMLVSYLNVKDAHRRRAAALNIQVCAGNDLLHLEEKLRTFLVL